MTSRKMSPLAWLGIALVVAIALMVLLGVLSTSGYGGYYGMMSGGSWGWTMVMMGIPAVVLIVVLLAALGGLGAPTAYPTYAPLGEHPLEILERRYAQGELAREDYLRIREDLTRGPTRS